ncbi:hypothetical protein [uncultured Dubosiella sp.]|uniref:hypothetical protein n=1 Tax=uncultured Dubosiella sp. TaxID=1937011 RepID=UPI0027305DAC|nr:hypothetical protein [uncultured Dubosiella sp.]
MEFFLIILILIGLFMFAFYMLPILIPFLIIVSVLGAVRRALQKNKRESEFTRQYESYFTSEEPEQPKVQTREKRPDAIDVEYVEYEEKDKERP